MPQQDELVHLNKLQVDKAELGEFLIANHELARRVLEGTYPARVMAKALHNLMKQNKKFEPQLYAARQAAWKLPRESRLHALMHIALLTREPEDISDACTCAELLKTTEAYDYMMRLYYQLGIRVEHEPIKRFLCENADRKKMCEKLDRNYIGRKVFGYEDPDCSSANTWQAECDEVLQLDSHPLFDDYLLKLLEATKLIRATAETDFDRMKQTAAALCDKISGCYAKAKAMCIQRQLDELRARINLDLASLVNPDGQRNPCDLSAILDVLLAASELFRHTRDMRDLPSMNPNVSFLLSETACQTSQYCNLPNLDIFNKNFWQNIAISIDLGMVIFFRPDSWLHIYLQPRFNFNDETCDPDHPVFDPERRAYSVEQKIAAYLVMAEDWPGDVFKRDHLERAYNYALALDDSYYKVLTLCDIYELKMRFGLDKKNKRG